MRNQFKTRCKEKTCVKCSKIFLGRVTQDKCPDCQRKKNRPSLKKPFKQHTCNLCGTIFTGSVARKNCDACSKNRPTPKTKQENPCTWCGCEFESARKVSRFCSYKCSSSWLNAEGLGPKHNDGVLLDKIKNIIKKENRSMTKDEICSLGGFTHKVLKARGIDLKSLYADLDIPYQKNFSSFFEQNGYQCLKSIGFSDEDIVYQKTFQDLKGKRKMPLRFDFYIKSLNLLIELDGNQHVKIGKFSKNENDFLRSAERDLAKESYAKAKNINFIRVGYEKNYYTLLQKLQQSLAPYIGDGICDPL
jgi:hypothetical protein